MDLIYANEIRIDQGVLQNYTLDLAYGSGENDFECKMDLKEPECKPGYYLYIDGTEYGGIIDAIAVDTESETLTYKGRTWHGILNSKVIEPDAGEDYWYAKGEANAVIGQILERVEIGIPFAASAEDSGIKVNYPLRYRTLYEGISAMLEDKHAKLIISWENGNVVLSAKLITDYSLMEEFDSSQIAFGLEKHFRHVNHLICLGSGELKDRHVIHLFCDENGGVQPYLLDPGKEPLQDSDYILDKRNQLYFGKEEYTAVYDYNTAETAENYKPMEEKPDNWDASYDDYYKKSGNGYHQLERNIQDVYTLLTSQPPDWNRYERYYTYSSEYDSYEPITGDLVETYTALSRKPAKWDENYTEYYKKSGSEYESLAAVEKYTLLSAKPDDWEKNYNAYYRTDGTTYYNIYGDSVDAYILQSQQPSDWQAKWTDYYSLVSGQFEKLEVTFAYLGKAPIWRKNSFYTKGYDTVAPEYGSGTLEKVYEKTMVAPAFTAGAVYKKTESYTKAWQANTYYELKAEQDLGIEFVPGAYFEQVFDNYAELAEGGLERLAELNNLDVLDIDLEETAQTYDIGDVVGARENITGIFVSQKVTKKIIKIEKDIVSIRYEVS